MKLSWLLIWISLGVLLPIIPGFAQVESGAFGLYNEALTFSRTIPGGSARIQGIGGAQIALGGDISSVMSNPAGLGFYNRSEFSISPGLNFYNSETSFFGQSTGDGRTVFNFANMGAVLNRTKGDHAGGKWRGGSFGISVNRINDFNQEFTYGARNTDNSIIDYFIEQSETISPDQLDGLTRAAYDHFVINPFQNNPYLYDSFILGFPVQQERVKTSGSQYQISLAAGGNYADKLYFGANLGINTLYYEETKTFVETDYFDPNFPNDPEILSELRIEEVLEISGIGVSGTFGVIYRLSDMIRLGGSVVTPTSYNLDEESAFDFITDYNNYFYVQEDTLLNEIITLSDITVSDYKLRTPWKFTAGAAIFLGKRGFITGDVEFINYGKAHLKSDDFFTGADNQTITNLYKSVANIRLGAEFRIKSIRLRGGYAYLPDPYNLNDGIDRSRSSFSGGTGFRNQKFFVDLAVTYTRWDSTYSPYTVVQTPSPIVEIEHQNTNGVLTVGFFF